jgi:hypothetical protein
MATASAPSNVKMSAPRTSNATTGKKPDLLQALLNKPFKIGTLSEAFCNTILRDEKGPYVKHGMLRYEIKKGFLYSDQKTGESKLVVAESNFPSIYVMYDGNGDTAATLKGGKLSEPNVYYSITGRDGSKLGELVETLGMGTIESIEVKDQKNALVGSYKQKNVTFLVSNSGRMVALLPDGFVFNKQK